MTFEEYCK